MQNYVVLAVDTGALIVVILAVWLVAYRRSRLGISLAALGIASMAVMASLRALPSPTRDELAAKIGVLNEQVVREKQNVADLQEKNAGLQGDLVQQKEEARRLAEKASGLEGDLREQVAASRQQRSDAFERLINALAKSHYSVRTHEDDEWIEGKRGRYYRVRLHDPQTRQPFIFSRGEYRAQSHAVAVLQSFAAFKSEVVKSVPTDWTTQLFLRGGATAEPLTSTTGPLGLEFGAVRYRRENDKGRYSAPNPALPFPPQTTNADLPLLRAAEYRTILFGASGADDVELLHREPAGIAEEERVVEIVLYVKPN